MSRSSLRPVLRSVLSLATAGLGLLWLPLAAEAQHNHASGVAHGLPDFCAGATLTATGSGTWSNANVWSGHRVPGVGDIVVIAGGARVTYDAQSSAAVKAVCVDGELVFRTNASTRLTVGTLFVRPTGALEVGSESSPVVAGAVAEIVIANQALETTVDPEQYGTGLVGLGRVTMHGAIKSPTFVRLAQEAAAGQTSLGLSQPVSGWQAGDKLVVPDSKQWAIETRAYAEEWEEPVIAGVSGSSVTLASGLRFNHRGARDGNDSLEFLPHVGNLSRNVVVRSEAPTGGTRGHVMFNNRANVDIRYALFKDLGRTTIAPLNSTAFSGDTVTRVGTNQIGRYSLHMHHVFGPQTTPANGYQYTLIGNAIDNGTKWGVTVHNSHYGLIADNVIYNAAGAGVMAEDGTESFNVFERNFVVRSRGTGAERGDERINSNDWGWEGTAFWFRGPNNIVRDNVGANSNSFAYAVFPLNLNIARVPKFKGADTTVAGQYDVWDMQATPLREFARNEVYASVSALTLWDVGADCCTAVKEVAESVVKDFRAWHISRYGYYGYGHNRVTFDGWVQRGDKNVLANQYEKPRGFWFGDYITRNLTIRNANIQNLRFGIEAPPKPGDTRDIYGPAAGTTRIQDSYLRNQYNIVMRPMWAVTGGLTALPPRRVFIDNVRFDNVAGNIGGGSQWAISMNFSIDARNANVIQQDQVFVTSFNGAAGNNFQAFYSAQTPDYVVPQTKSNLTGAPTAGLTNSQAMAAYGIAIGGAIAPCATSVAGVQGFACTGTFTPPRAPTNVRVVTQQ